MGRGSHDLPRPRARAGGFRPSRCGRRSRPPRSDIAVVAATICRSSTSRDQESRQPPADQTELMVAIDIAMQQRSYIAPQQLYKFFLQLICKLAGNEFAGRSAPARGKGTDRSTV